MNVPDSISVWDALEFVLAVKKAWDKTKRAEMPGYAGKLLEQVTDTLGQIGRGMETVLFDGDFYGDRTTFPETFADLKRDLGLLDDE